MIYLRLGQTYGLHRKMVSISTFCRAPRRVQHCCWLPRLAQTLNEFTPFSTYFVYWKDWAPAKNLFEYICRVIAQFHWPGKERSPLTSIYPWFSKAVPLSFRILQFFSNEQLIHLEEIFSKSVASWSLGFNWKHPLTNTYQHQVMMILCGFFWCFFLKKKNMKTSKNLQGGSLN